ncbi:MAG: barstar family protein [Clostridiales bacterium]|nr:barstar family protein [Clostridiales bacterium]
MTTIIIDGRRLKTKKRAHEYLAEKLSFPSYYGKNLDALHDVLTSYGKPTCLRVRYPASITTNLGKYGETLLQVLNDAEKVNKNISIDIE